MPVAENVLAAAPDVPASMTSFYEGLVERTDAFAKAHASTDLVPLMREFARCVAAEGESNAQRRTQEQWARGIALSALIAIMFDEPGALDSEDIRIAFLDAVGVDVDATAQCTADVLVSAGVLDLGADWSLPC